MTIADIHKISILDESGVSGSPATTHTREDVTAIQQTYDIDMVEKHMLTLPPVDCPVEHIFGPGIYIRQVFMPAGALVVGHSHKHESLNVVLSGKLALIENGVRREVAAPYIFTGSVGRKVALILEDCVFQNIFATTETDIEKLEEMFVEKSEAFKEIEQ